MTNKSSNRSLVKLPVVMAAAIWLLASCGGEPEEQGGGFGAPSVSVAEVIVREVTPWEEFSGRIEAKEIVQVRPRVGGVIDSIHYREGDIVKQGDLLFVIDQQPFQAEQQRAEAELERAQAQAKLARLESRRAKNLVKRKLLSEDEYDRRIAAENQANANVRSAQATLELARLNLTYTEVRSPIDGRAGRVLVTRGNVVASNSAPDTLTTILSMDPIYVVFDSDELTYLRYFNQPSSSQDQPDQRKVFIGLGNQQGFPHEGYVDFVDNRVAPTTGTIRLRAVLDNKDHSLVPGLFARVKLLATKPEQAILITDESILTDQDRKYVYVLGEQNQATRRDIEIGRTAEGFRIVTKGLKPGDQVIVHGIQKVFFPNMPVAPQVITMGDPPPVAKPGSKPGSESAQQSESAH